MKLISNIKSLILREKQKREDLKKFKADIIKYVQMQNVDDIFKYNHKFEYPILSDYRVSAANLDEHYFLQDIWFAKKIILSKPSEHYDIGSRVDGFLSHLLSAGINVNMIDIRPLDIKVDGLFFTQGDATDLCNIPAESVQSLSSLHVLEHFGLGRYGDPIDPSAWIKGLKAMQRIIVKGGMLYLSFPTGPRNVLRFNAHRIIEYHEVVNVLNEMELVETAYISDYVIHEVSLEDYQNTVPSEYSCALYIFRKK